MLVRLVQGVGDLGAEAIDLVEGQASLRQAMGEALALQELHDQVFRIPLVADVMERADVRMVERRDGLRLAFEAHAGIAAPGQARGQDLDRDRAVEPRVPGLVDLPHPAGADRRDDLVGAETGAGLEFHGTAAKSSTRRSPAPTAAPAGRRSPRPACREAWPRWRSIPRTPSICVARRARTPAPRSGRQGAAGRLAGTRADAVVG